MKFLIRDLLSFLTVFLCWCNMGISHQESIKSHLILIGAEQPGHCVSCTHHVQNMIKVTTRLLWCACRHTDMLIPALSPRNTVYILNKFAFANVFLKTCYL